MNWSNIRLIFLRELRDQLRDRRTLFTIAVLPLLLYPFLGMSFLQVAQFMREHPSQVWIVGAEALPQSPPLVVDGRLSSELAGENDRRLLQLTIDDRMPADVEVEQLHTIAQHLIKAGQYDAVVYFPPNFAEQLNVFGEGIRRPASSELEPQASEVPVPEPMVFVNGASDKSRIARDRLNSVLRTWREAIVQQNLLEGHIPLNATRPFQVVDADVADEANLRAAIWSKILPFVALVWALTGAFYPAVDLCAGEKERGTLETLLSSPALRSEIVWGKLLTVTAFSMATAILNLLSMGLTGALIMQQMGRVGTSVNLAAMGAPPLASLGWLILALIPISAMFSALSLAIASFARSTKEGQYYLMPVLLITLPLMMLPMLPSTELDLGTSLIPVTGVLLLLRTLIEGQYSEAMLYGPPVVAITAVCCLLAIRWAVDQFNNESVLFRESERFGVGLWLRHVMRERGDTPTMAEGVLCGILLLLIHFFASMYISVAPTWQGFATAALITQIAFIATPALVMTIMLTRSPRKALLLRMPRPLALPAAVLLAVMLHPAAMTLAGVIKQLYPLSDDTLRSLQPIMHALSDAPLGYVLLLVAVVPAICEELAFRGFVLSGLRHMGHKWAAIALASVFFGVTHGILQQSLTAASIGLVLGYVAVQSGSLLPCILFHMTHNGLSVLSTRIDAELLEQYPLLQWLVQMNGDGMTYTWPAIASCGTAALMLLYWFRRLPYQPYAEERLREGTEPEPAAVSPVTATAGSGPA